MSKFNFVMISAGFEHGGNVTHRHLDGHPNMLVYPFESQLGNRNFNDFLASIERVQYRYPEFPEGLTAEELYEQIIDEEMKTFLRKRNDEICPGWRCQTIERTSQQLTESCGGDCRRQRTQAKEKHFYHNSNTYHPGSYPGRNEPGRSLSTG